MSKKTKKKKAKMRRSKANHGKRDSCPFVVEQNSHSSIPDRPPVAVVFCEFVELGHFIGREPIAGGAE
jgi:hypothetical protein